LSTLAFAKHRTLRRRHQAGAAMFVVSMMVTVLAAVGMFALAAAATEVKSAGNERQNTQTHYLAEFGILAFARETETGKVQTYISMGMATADKCLSLPLPSPSLLLAGNLSPLAKACYRVEPADFQRIGGWGSAPTVPYTGSQPYSAGAVNPGSLGPIPMGGVFYVEVTDVSGSGRPAPGYSAGWAFPVVTGTSFGQTQPLVSGAVAYGAVGMEMQRARYVAGPLYTGPQ
jgi:hypothetical protein